MTSEALKQKFYEILFFNKEKYDTDDVNFVIPYVSMNDGHTPAQIRYESEGIYHDIPRSPFKRITGKIGEDGKIPDIDITSLVKYGSLEQAKIAPTLENIDIKLYFREPNLKKIRNNTKNTGMYADSYVWREALPGFHLYNNDTLYGYEWVVLQDEYSTMDGVYNLSMNIEDGLGVCKLAGTQAPISLKGVQYKIIITAKNLWTREYSLMEDTFPILTNLDSDSDEFAPSLNAVKKYYREKVLTKNATVDETLTVAEKTTIDENGINTNSIKTGDIEVEGKKIIYSEDLSEHINDVVKNAAVDENENLRGPHGIVNEGIDGNIDAKTLDGLELGTGARSVTQNKKFPAYIPFVDEDNFIGFGNDFGFFTKRSSKDDPATKLANLNLVAGRAPINSVMQDVFIESMKINGSDLKGFVKNLVISDENFNISYIPGNTPSIEITSGVSFSNNVEFKVGSLSTKSIITDSLKIGGSVINKDNILGLLNGSSIAYKRVISELLPYNVKEAASSYLEPNLKYDADGELVQDLDTTSIEGNALLVSQDLKNHIPTNSEILDKDKATFDKLGSALQAIYEMPMASYVYKRGQNEYKQQLGILIERVNQIRDTIAEARGEDANEFSRKNYVVHKRNTLVKSSVYNVGEKRTEGAGSLTDDKVIQNAYTYSDDEIKSIIHYLDLTTSKKELQQELRNTVGILLKAAKETQERLLNVETSIYGWDSPTIPGPKEDRETFVNSHIDESLRDSVTNSSMLLGLNRLVKAICLELFDTADLERIEAEEESRVTDTEDSKVSVKTRMDQIDEVMSVLYNQSSAIVKYYMENVVNDESNHSYVDMYTSQNSQIISNESQEEEDLQLEEVTHDLYKDSYDAGRKWKNLASEEELNETSKAMVGFAQVSENAHKHSPNKNETGIVRIPSIVKKNSEDISEGEIEHEDISKYIQNNKILRNWQLFKVDKTKNSVADDYAANGTYAPIFKSKLVAWESSKVERINLKLSELTKAVYGVDDVVAAYPNRTEVLRRNITNLVDDLYPNRSFSVENKVDIQGDPTAEIYKPFKKSNKTLSENFEKDKLVSKENPTADEGSLGTHKSIIPYFDAEIFNFKIENHFKGKGLKTGKAGSEYKEGKQIDMSSENQIIFRTDNLVTDNVPFNEKYGTYLNAFSRIDMLEDILGVENSYISSLYEDNILSTGDYLDYLQGPASGTNEQKIADIKKKISLYSYEILKVENNIKPVKEFLNSQSEEMSSLEKKIEEKEREKVSVEEKISANETEQNSLREANATYLQNINEKENNSRETSEKLALEEEKRDRITLEISESEKKIEDLQNSITLLGDDLGVVKSQAQEISKWNNFKTNINDSIEDLKTHRETTVNQIKNSKVDTADLSSENFIRSAGYISSPDIEDRSTWGSGEEGGNPLVLDNTGSFPAENTDLHKLIANTEWDSGGNKYKYIKQGNIEYERKLTKQTSIRRRTYLKQITSLDGLPTLYTEDSRLITPTETTEGLKLYYYTENQWNAILAKEAQVSQLKNQYTTAEQALTNAYNTYSDANKGVDAAYGVVNLTSPGVFSVDLFNILKKENTFSYFGNDDGAPSIDAFEYFMGVFYDYMDAKIIGNYKDSNLITGGLWVPGDISTDKSSNAKKVKDFLNELKIGHQAGESEVYKIKSDLFGVIDGFIADCDRIITAVDNYNEKIKIRDNKEAIYKEAGDKKNEAEKAYNTALSELQELRNIRETWGTTPYFDDPNFRSYTLQYNIVKKDENGNKKYDIFLTFENINCLDEITSSYKDTVSGVITEDSQKVENYISEILEKLSIDRDFIGNTFNWNISESQKQLLDKYEKLTTELNNTKNERDQLSLDLIDTRDTIEKLKQQIADLGEEISGLKSKNVGVLNKIEELEEELNSLEKELSKIESELNILEIDRKNLNAKIEEQEELLKKLTSNKESLESSLEVARLELAESSFGNNALPYFVGELTFLDFSVVIDDKPAGSATPSGSLLSSSNVSYVLSRKSKRIQERVTTTEAFLDSLTQGLHYGNYILKTLEKQKESEATKNINERFEETEVRNILKRICDASELKQTGNYIFDLDLSESYPGCEDHNRKVWQRVPYSLNVTKSNYTTESDGVTGSYLIKGKMVSDPDLLPFQDTTYRIEKGVDWTINVKYVKSITEAINSDTIYLKLKVSDNSNLYAKFVKTEDATAVSSEILTGASSFQNQTEYNIYKTLKHLFTSLFTLKNDEQNLYYRMMLKAHPVGSIFSTFDNAFDPAKQFGGSWKRLSEDAALYSRDGKSPDYKNPTTVDVSHTHSIYYKNTLSGSTASHNHSYDLTTGWGSSTSTSDSGTGYANPSVSVGITINQNTGSNTTSNKAYILNVWVRTGA